jgi:UrcA family protein
LRVLAALSLNRFDLTTPAGAAEFKRRVSDAAKEACDKVDSANPTDLLDTDDTAYCVRTATHGAMKQVKAVIAAARTNSASGSDS